MPQFEEPEGATPLDPDEMDDLKFKHITTRGELDHLEQANIQEGLSWLARQKSPDIYTEEFVRKLHQKLFAQVWQWAGIPPTTLSVQLMLTGYRTSVNACDTSPARW